jgi:hypothetical protein
MTVQRQKRCVLERQAVPSTYTSAGFADAPGMLQACRPVHDADVMYLMCAFQPQAPHGQWSACSFNCKHCFADAMQELLCSRFLHVAGRLPLRNVLHTSFTPSWQAHLHNVLRPGCVALWITLRAALWIHIHLESYTPLGNR